jgi:hypothetical protein
MIELESSIEDDVVCWAENRNWWVRKVKYIGQRAAPDRWFAKNGRLIIIEFKRDRRGADPLQAREHKKMRAAGLEVHTVSSRDAAVKLLGGERYVRD